MIMQDNEKKPALRFKGFTDPWEQRKLEEYLEVSGQKNFEGIYTKEDVLSVSGDFGIVNQIEFQGRSFAGASVANYGVVETGDIVYTKSPLKSNPYGIIKANKGKNGIVSTLYAVYKPKQSANPEFVQIYFEQDARMNNYMHPLVNKGAKNDMKVSAENALKGQIVFPDIKEQRTISEFFHNLDTLITLHQRKYEKLVNIKKSMLDKMFPQNGVSVPEIRFKGFTDPWEQRKLSELTSMHARIGWQNLRTSEFLDSGDYMLITGTDFDDGTVNYSTCHFVERERYEQDKNIQIRNGSILITKDGTLGKVAYVQGLSMPATLNAGVFNVEIRNTSIVDERYLFQYLKAPFLMDYVDKKATGGTIKHLNQNILVDFPVVMPKKTEQVSIGNFFQRIDTLITLHQRKLEKLQNIKKSCLEKMFV